MPILQHKNTLSLCKSVWQAAFPSSAVCCIQTFLFRMGLVVSNLICLGLILMIFVICNAVGFLFFSVPLIIS